ncbi:metalloregulator ArsR/SmtB family transcription factor [Roseisolibacter sp. H3M3-2]|nr:metalloregulator ArsR/SmtB family transcription factor [Roseisolibacter sp. H3M3-2]
MQVLDALAALADPIRGRIVLALERHELAVGELAAALQLPQSTVSRHLKTLVDAGWVDARAEGASRRYRLLTGARTSPTGRLWGAVREGMASLPGATHDAERLRAVLAERRSASRNFFSTSAEAWDRLRVELFGARADVLGLLALLDDALVVGDLGCGTGAAAEALAPFVHRVIAVDRSQEMLALARLRLDGRANVELREGDLEALPLEDGELDAALVALVLHHLADPAAVLAEAARVLRPGGRLLVVDMLPHDREVYRLEMGHAWLGFDRETLERWVCAAGFERLRFVPVPPDPAGKGPPLFAASARRAVAAAAPTVLPTAAPAVAGASH